jgi:hypothetical protein
MQLTWPSTRVWLFVALCVQAGGCKEQTPSLNATRPDPRPPPVAIPVEVTLRVDRTYRLGQHEMPISIEVRNAGTTPIELPVGMSAPLHWLDVDLTGPDGKEVPPRAPGMQTPGWYQRSKVAPGESRVVRQDVGLIKAIKSPGGYTIKARFGQSPREDIPNFVSVESATTTFIVEPQ